MCSSDLTQQKTDVYGYYQAYDNYSTDATFVTDISLNPYIRGQQIEFTADSLLANERVGCYFDGTNVTDRIRITNSLILEYDTNNTFYKGDILAFYNDGTYTNQTGPFVKFGKVMSVGTINRFSGDLKTKLDVVWDLDTPTYTTGRTNPYSCDIVSLN